jgi:hypothetical protein
MNFADKIGDAISEAVYGSIFSDKMYKDLKGFYARDNEYGGSTYSTNNKDQVVNQISRNKESRDYIYSRIDSVKELHLAMAIKNIIISDCFNNIFDRDLISITYRSSSRAKNNLFNKEIKKMLKKTRFLQIFKHCLVNEGFDYCEVFVSTECKVGEGIVEVSDDLDFRRLVAVYKNLLPIGFLRFEESDNPSKVAKVEKFIYPDEISHFMVSPKKIPLKVNYGFNRSYPLPEKIMCSEPILNPVIDLIIEYNSLERVRTAIEIIKATAPMLVSMGINSNSTIDEIRQQLQQYSISLNQGRNAVINNLHSQEVQNLLPHLLEMKIIPYDPELGTNTIRQVSVEYADNELTEKINDLKATIARAVGIPESYLTQTTLITDKTDSLLSNPRYSRLLSGIQESLAEGIALFIYKHLHYRFSILDDNGRKVTFKEIDIDDIEVKFKSTTNINDRLDMEQKLVAASTMAQIVGVIDTIAGSPNIPATTTWEKFNDLWQDITGKHIYMRDMLVEDPNHQSNMSLDQASMLGDMSNPDDNNENDEEQFTDNSDDTNNNSNNTDIRDVFK